METENKYLLPMSVVVAGIIIAGGIYLDVDEPRSSTRSTVYESVAAKDDLGLVLPATWGNLGRQMVLNGTIDEDKFRAVYAQSGFSPEYEKLLLGENNGKIKITKHNAGYLLNLLWALGLSNKNEILENGEMADPRYGGAGNFASTGGWTIALGGAMNHYSMHSYFELTPEEQELVDKVSKDIYRPCCSNSAHFPDCNHGMAMLGLLELMASQGVEESEMRSVALAVNNYWFPPKSNAGGCGVESGAAPIKQSGCGI
ncbi:MAG: hypothetical protein Q7S54_01315 [bacterium]|nr:hypothetical protein [bacterium]